MPASAYRRHDAASQTKYQEARQLAQSQRRILAGTPGTLKQRTKSGHRYWVREYIRVDGKKSDEHIGAFAAVPAAAVEQIRHELDIAKALASSSAALRLFGYQRIERKPAAVLAVLFNRGLVNGGLVLVGSHAYAALLNELGIIATGYKTQDIDIARGQPLSVALPQGSTFESVLNESGLRFVPVPAMPSRRPSTSFKMPGAELLAVDLLAPGNETGAIVPVKELGAHAQAIALLDYLTAEPVRGIVLSPNQVIPVHIPAPERFVVHKLLSSQSRRADRGKAGKDLAQAAVLAAALEDETPGSIPDAFRRLPASGRPAARRGAGAAAKLLEDTHPAGHRLLVKLAAR